MKRCCCVHGSHEGRCCAATDASTPDERQAITDRMDLRCALAILTLAIDVAPVVDLDMVRYLFNQVRSLRMVPDNTRPVVLKSSP